MRTTAQVVKMQQEALWLRDIYICDGWGSDEEP